MILDGLQLATLCRDLAANKKAQDPVVLDLRMIGGPSDFFVIVSAREWLQSQPGALAARMSGSGSTVFGLWLTKREAEQVASRAKTHFGSEAWIQAAQLICGAK